MKSIRNYINFKNLTYNWEEIEKLPEFAALKKARQNPKWHKEGNALIHTKKVCEAAIIFARQNYLPNDRDAAILLTAALFHDIGKGVTTEIGTDGNWHSLRHEIEGEKLTRKLLWDEEVNFRESVCALVRYHMGVIRLFGTSDMFAQIVKISYCTNWKILLALVEADIAGSINKQSNHDAANYTLSRLHTIIKSMGCLNMPFGGNPFFSPYALSHYNDAGRIWLSDKSKHITQVIVLIGLAGSGKSTFVRDYIKNNKEKDIVVLSRDSIRPQLGICKNGEKKVGNPEEETAVSEAFDKKLISSVKKGKTVIIDNLNLKRKYRDQLKTTLKGFPVEWNYVYIEAKGIKTNISRRKGVIDEEIIRGMQSSLEWPEYGEYDTLQISVNEDK